MENPDFGWLAVQLEGLVLFLLGAYTMQEGHLPYGDQKKARPAYDDLRTLAIHHIYFFN